MIDVILRYFLSLDEEEFDIRIQQNTKILKSVLIVKLVYMQQLIDINELLLFYYLVELLHVKR